MFGDDRSSPNIHENLKTSDYVVFRVLRGHFNKIKVPKHIDVEWLFPTFHQFVDL